MKESLFGLGVCVCGVTGGLVKIGCWPYREMSLVRCQETSRDQIGQAWIHVARSRGFAWSKPFPVWAVGINHSHLLESPRSSVRFTTRLGDPNSEFWTAAWLRVLMTGCTVVQLLETRDI